jgi:hypothetical protein
MKVYALTIGIAVLVLLASCGDLGMEPVEIKPVTLTVTSNGNPVELVISTNNTGTPLAIVEKPKPVNPAINQ